MYPSTPFSPKYILKEDLVLKLKLKDEEVPIKFYLRKNMRI